MITTFEKVIYYNISISKNQYVSADKNKLLSRYSAFWVMVCITADMWTKRHKMGDTASYKINIKTWLLNLNGITDLTSS